MSTSRRSQIALLAVVAALAAAVATAPGASAAGQWYAGPTGAGTDCSFEKPCNIVLAIQWAPSGTEVILKPGDYAVDYTIENKAPVTIHGVAGQPRPRLYLAPGTQLRLHGVKLTGAEVVQVWPGGAALGAWDSELNQVIVRGGPQADCAAAIFNGLMRNSIVVAQNPDGNAICSQSFQGVNSSTYLNVTAIAQRGDAIQALAGGDDSASVSLLVSNVIARAGSGGFGLAARTAAAGADASIAALHTNLSNYLASDPNTIVAEAADTQHMSPVFVDPAAGDYRQKAGSPTIDAGTPEEGVGTEDVDGDQRAVGRIDIGADEFVPPPAPSTGPAPSDQPSTTGPDPTGTQTSPAGSFAGVKLLSSRLLLKGRFVVVKLSCPAGTAGACAGATKLTARRPRTASRAAATVKLGRAGFSIAAGGRAKVKVPVSRAGRRLFAHTRRLRGRAASAAHDAAGLSKTTSAHVTIRRG